MGYEIPTFSKCCFFFPRRLGLLAYGYIKIILSILLEAINISLLLKLKSTASTVLIGAQVTSLIVDCGSTVVLIIGCHKNHVLCISWYYIYSLYISLIKIFFMFILCFMEPLLILSAIGAFLLNGYLLLLIRSERIDVMKNNGNVCEFVNKLANPECNIKIEVVDYVVPEKEVPNNMFIVNGTDTNPVNDKLKDNGIECKGMKPIE